MPRRAIRSEKKKVDGNLEPSSDITRGFGSSRNGVNGRNVRNLPPGQGGRNFGGGVLPFGGYQGFSSSSCGMLYEFLLDAHRMLRQGEIGEYGCTVENGQFWMKRGDDSARITELLNQLEACMDMINAKDLRIQELEENSSQESFDDLSTRFDSGKEAECAALRLRVKELEAALQNAADEGRVSREKAQKLEGANIELQQDGKDLQRQNRELTVSLGRSQGRLKKQHGTLEERDRRVQALTQQSEAWKERIGELEEQFKEVSHEHRLCQQKLQSCEGRNREMALKLQQTQVAAALMQVEEGAVRAMNEAKLLRVQGELDALERGVARFESDVRYSSVICLTGPPRLNALQFGLTSCGLLEVINGDKTNGLCMIDDGEGEDIAVTWRLRRPGDMKIDRDIPSDDNSASEAGSVVHRAVAESRRSDDEIERERIRIQFRRDERFRKQALRQWKDCVDKDR